MRASSDAAVAALDVLLYGSNEALHDYHAGAAGSFRQLVSSLGRVRAARMPFGCTAVVTRSNYRHLSEVVRVAHTLGARGLRFVPASGAIARPHAAMLRPHLERAIQLADALGLGWVAGDAASGADARTWFARHAFSSARTSSNVVDRQDAIDAELRSAGAA